MCVNTKEQKRQRDIIAAMINRMKIKTLANLELDEGHSTHRNKDITKIDKPRPNSSLKVKKD